MQSLMGDEYTDERLVANVAHRTRWRHIGLSGIAERKQAMEMTEYGKP
jgi:hypothetical protein